MKRHFKKIIAISISCTVAGLALALPPLGPAEGFTIAQISALSTASIAAIAAFGTSFSASMQYNFEQIISAVAVATKQEALSANIISQGIQKSSQVLITAMKSQKQAQDAVKATFDYSPATGQGFEPCRTNSRNQSLSNAYSAVEQKIGDEINNMNADNKPGFIVESKAEAMGQRLEQHYKMFCTQQEADMGLCSKSSNAGADVNAAYLFEPSERNSLKDTARQSYIQHIMGQPDEYPIKGAEQTIQAKTAFNNKIRKDALNSIPLYSLQAIRMSNLQQEEYQKNSPNQLLKARVNQYFGGLEADQWAGTLSTQTPRGLLVEAIKMHGLETWLHQRQYQQNQRLEANLAALILIDNQNKQKQMQQSYSNLINQNGK